MTQVTAQPIPWDEGEELATGSGQATLSSRFGLFAAENPDKVVAKKGLRVFEEMERKDAVALRGGRESKPSEPLPDRVSNYLDRQWDKCSSAEERTLFIHLVQNFLEHVT